MTFLPEDYKDVPQAPSSYMKFKNGPNRFRILSPAIVGWEYWNLDNKPVRQEKPFNDIPADIKLDPKGLPTRINHFWAFVVWNYEEKAIRILEITQATIQRAMKIKIDNRHGDALGYDFIITRTGKGLDTDYDIDTGNQEPVSPEIMNAYNAKKVNLRALYSGDDPFATEQKKSSPGAAAEVTESSSAAQESQPVVSQGVSEVRAEDVPF
jgi:hypothetical protein